ncbi:biotin synthase BioB [uncultured Anaerobiospirillum sp.]|uniref:biotin synthase BioB n=1 Tax=uncultured Anaerobiospirillum sp. TaxID=265728 RepID=UPI0028042043|nr:biotin synthase BioB [uncultured Anaerobiospirillum sp.]
MLDSSANKTQAATCCADTVENHTHCSCSDMSQDHARSTAGASSQCWSSTTSADSSSTCCKTEGSSTCGCHEAVDASTCGCEGKITGDMSGLIDGECHFEGMSDEAVAAEIEQRLVAGGNINGAEALYCMERMGLETLIELSHKITSQVASAHVSLCSITNVKSGKCTQDCKWCAQSAHFATGVDIYDVKSKEQCLEEARLCYNKGVEMFSLVAGGRKPSKAEFEKLIEIIDYIKENLPIKLCASLGLVDKEQLTALKEHGIERYHCNLETAPDFFKNVVTRHTVEDKIKTLLDARDIGMELCSGGIIGMGENDKERVELALAVRRLGIKSIPVNVLHPIAGTPLENQRRLSDEEVLRAICIFRLVNTDAHLRFAGGRALLSDETVNKAIYCGINAAIVGDLLTTLGSVVDEDRARFAKHHYDLPDIPAQVSAKADAPTLQA